MSGSTHFEVSGHAAPSSGAAASAVPDGCTDPSAVPVGPTAKEVR